MSQDKGGNKHISFMTCPVCGGQKKVGLLACKECQGLGYYFVTQQEVVYWGYPLDALHIILREWHRTVRNAIDVFLVLLLLVNIVILFLMGLAAEFQPLPWLHTLLISLDRTYGLFWVILIFNLYFFYRTYRQRVSPKGLIQRLREKNEKHTRVNIADVLHPTVITLFDRTWSDVFANKQMPIRPLQIFQATLKTDDVQMILARLGISDISLAETIARQIAYLPPLKYEDSITPELKDVLLQAYLTAQADRSQKLRMTDLFLSIVQSDEKIQELLYDMNVDITKVTNVIKWINFNNELIAQYRRYRSKALYKPKGPINRSYTAAATPFLDSFSSDLTQLARVGQLPLTVARDKEIEELFRVLEGGKSVVLVGEKGVGKVNIIEGLANRMAAEEVPAMFQDKRLVSLSLPFLVAGASQTGEVQERLLMIIQEIIRSGNIILAIQDIHNLVGVSSAGTQNIDLSEVLAQQIRSGAVWVIATSTPQYMTEYIQSSALSEELERVQVVEPDRNRAIQILESQVGYVESKNNVFFTYESLEKLVDLSDRYLHDQFLPSKAISLMSEVGAWVRERESKLIVGEDIATIVSRKTHIPLTQVTAQESKVLMNLDSIMHERIIGQDEAVNLVVSALRRARAELRDDKRPIVNLLFLGPTGVGKTELAKTIAAVYFGDEDAMIRLDMSEYQSQNSIARLLGEPGSNRGGILTEAVRQRPFALVLLDEIEKAHPDILNIFLQVMDDGRLTDALGRTVDFTNVILVATSNAGANYIQDEILKETPVEKIREGLVRGGILRDIFKPEFLNRFDGVVVFKPLSPDEIFQVAGLMLKNVQKRLETKGIALRITPAAQEELAHAGFDPIFGARPLRRVIQERVEESLANFLLKGSIGRRDEVVLDAGGVITVNKAEKL